MKNSHASIVHVNFMLTSLSSFLKKKYYFEIVIESQESMKKYTETVYVPFNPPPVLTSCIAIVKYQRQKIDMSIIYRVYSDFTKDVCMCVCVYTILSHVTSYSYNHSQGT